MIELGYEFYIHRVLRADYFWKLSTHVMRKQSKTRQKNMMDFHAISLNSKIATLDVRQCLSIIIFSCVVRKPGVV